MSQLVPHLEVLPRAQRSLWPKLRPAAPLGFALYGGTAIAIRVGHRTSIDFDFFCDSPLDRSSLFAAMSFLERTCVLHDRPDTLTVLWADEEGSSETVKISFFGAIGCGRVGTPQWTDDGVVQIASPEDLLGTKLKVILQRVEAKDYIDIAAILEDGMSLASGLGAARTLFGPAFQPSECLKALVYFEGGDLEVLSQPIKDRLIASVASVDDLPQVSIRDQRLVLR